MPPKKPGLPKPSSATNVGALPFTVPCSLPSTAPKPGRPPMVESEDVDQPESDCVEVCSSRMPVIERMIEYRLAC